MGLFEDDKEWVDCLEEALVMKIIYQLRRLFSIIQSESNSIQPEELWNKFWVNVYNDLAFKLHTQYNIQNSTEDHVKEYGMNLLDKLIFELGRTLHVSPPMPLPIGHWSPRKW
ncbi:hypothetical protein GIB67_017708 [Kingdonia uniflora]|uniref:Uncharacterized protein n=1 Tax=Kingdonia uniflora TaxID=39325 RepID=A0A7J7NAQ3_9MAGN|nr:hypothetical protein GIB67_017708 [Kingdonia uniflora]